MIRSSASAFHSFLLAGVLATASAADPSTAADPVIDFEKPSESAKWVVVNDGVMGGLSKGAMRIDDGEMTFTGTLSLENNGGFSLVETSNGAWDFSNASGLKVRVKGDGRTYQLRLGTTERTRGDRVSYTGEFTTEDGEWVERVVRFEDLIPMHRGELMDSPPLDPANVEQIGILIGDKNPGTFAIQVDWIDVD